MIRRLAASLTAVALLLALAAPALAGGWAEIVADAGTAEPPVEGKPLVVGFRVLQHGETPAPWETATVHFTNTSTGQTMDVAATNDREDGHFTLRDLASDHLPVSFAVYTAGGRLPTYDPATTATAIAQAKRDVRAELSAQFQGEIQRLDGLLLAQGARSDRLLAQTDEILAERDALATRLAAAEGAGGLPILAILTLAVLAGATAGFAMSWLVGRPSPKVAVSPAPRGADPA
jgi:hypothetical protein